MQVLVDGYDIKVPTASVTESVFNYCSVLTFVSDVPLVDGERIELATTGRYPFVAVKSSKADRDRWSYTCYPESYVNFLNSRSAPVNIKGDFKKMLDSVGVDAELIHKTQDTHWNYPSMKGKYAIDKFLNDVVAVDGGCPTMFFSFTGTLFFSDLLSECLQPAKGVLFGDTEQMDLSLTQQNEYSGKVDFTFYNEDTFKTRTCTFLEGAGYGSVFQYLANDDNEELIVRSYQSSFWRNYINTSKLLMNNVQIERAMIGTKVSIPDREREFILVSCETTLSSGTVTNRVELFPCIIPTQTL